MRDVSRSGAEPVEGGVEPRAAIDEGGSIVYPMFCTDLVEEHPRGDGCSRRKQADLKEVIRLGINGGK